MYCHRHGRYRCADYYCRQDNNYHDSYRDNAGQIGINNEGEMTIGIGNGMSIDSDGDLNIGIGGGFSFDLDTNDNNDSGSFDF